jgi:nucleolar complex protein 3
MGKKRIRLEKSGDRKPGGAAAKSGDADAKGGKNANKVGSKANKAPPTSNKPKPKPKPVEAKLTPKGFHEKCTFIAELSEAILQDPRQAFVASRHDPFTVVAIHENAQEGGGDKEDGDNDNDDDDVDEDDEEVGVKRVNRMKRLIDMANQGGKYDKANFSSKEERQHVARLAMVSLLAIFTDILPSYRIRPPTSEERNIRVSKETKQLWDYESQLLTHYQQYLNILEQTWDALGKRSFPPPALAATSVICLCELLKSAMHFNFRSRILQVVVRTLNYNASKWLAQKAKALLLSEGDDRVFLGDLDDDLDLDGDTDVTANAAAPKANTESMITDAHEINVQCCEALKYVFVSDKQGDVALEAVRLMTKQIKDRKCSGVHPLVLETFQKLPLRVHADEAEAAKLHDQAAKKNRKKNKLEAVIEDELHETKATVDRSLLARAQAATLEQVTLTYFRVIQKAAEEFTSNNQEQEENANGNGKNGDGTGPKRPMASSTTRFLLPVTLEGLAKIAHLINLDTVLDLLDVLKQLLKNVDQLPLDAALNCVLTSFQTLQGPGRELQIDPKEYVTPLYFQLPRYVCVCMLVRELIWFGLARLVLVWLEAILDLFL